MLPVLTIFQWEISSYVLLSGLGVWAASFAMDWINSRAKAKALPLWDLYLLLALGWAGLFAGAKLLGILIHLPRAYSHWLAALSQPRQFFSLLFQFGSVFYGGLLGALAIVYIASQKRGLDFAQVGRLFAPGLSLFLALARLGCFLGGCCYGIPFTPGLAMAHSPHIPRLPVQLLEAAFCALLFLLFARLARQGKPRLLSAWLCAYASFRFCMEFLRAGYTPRLLGLTLSQWISLGLLFSIILPVLVHKLLK